VVPAPVQGAPAAMADDTARRQPVVALEATNRVSGVVAEVRRGADAQPALDPADGSAVVAERERRSSGVVVGAGGMVVARDGCRNRGGGVGRRGGGKDGSGGDAGGGENCPDAVRGGQAGSRRHESPTRSGLAVGFGREDCPARRPVIGARASPQKRWALRWRTWVPGPVQLSWRPRRTGSADRVRPARSALAQRKIRTRCPFLPETAQVRPVCRGGLGRTVTFVTPESGRSAWLALGRAEC